MLYNGLERRCATCSKFSCSDAARSPSEYGTCLMHSMYVLICASSYGGHSYGSISYSCRGWSNEYHRLPSRRHV